MLEVGPDGVPVERQQLGNSLRSFLNARDDAPSQPVFDDLRDRSTAEGKHWCSARHGLDHDQSEGLGPIDRKKQSCRSTEKLSLGALVDFTNKLDFCPVQKRSYHLPEEAFIHLINLRRNFKREARSTRNSNGTVGPFLRRDATKKRKIAPGRLPTRLPSSMAAMRCTTRSPSFGGVLWGLSLRP